MSFRGRARPREFAVTLASACAAMQGKAASRARVGGNGGGHEEEPPNMPRDHTRVPPKGCPGGERNVNVNEVSTDGIENGLAARDSKPEAFQNSRGEANKFDLCFEVSNGFCWMSHCRHSCAVG